MSVTPTKNDLLLRACKGKATERMPVWIMRQAGRYLPEYRKVRAAADFITMCHTPELAAEVTLQPVDIIEVDAAIIFSDILVIPEAMGMALEFHEGRGPVFEQPIRCKEDLDRLRAVEVEEDLSYMLDALKLVRKELAGRVPLIGFAGAPWTLAAYMVEGHGTRNFARIKGMMYSEPEILTSLLGKLATAVSNFLIAQIKNGAEVVQLFDSWAGILTPEYFRNFSLPYLHQVVQNVAGRGAPIIVFARDAGHSYHQLSNIGADVLSVSWTEDLITVREEVADKVVLQGNLDPCVLFSCQEKIKAEVQKTLAKVVHRKAHIFNLGHGILPQTPVDNVKAMVNFVKEESSRLVSAET